MRGRYIVYNVLFQDKNYMCVAYYNGIFWKKIWGYTVGKRSGMLL